jgi:magnesium-transporting ATPase (P-type)
MDCSFGRRCASGSQPAPPQMITPGPRFAEGKTLKRLAEKANTVKMGGSSTAVHAAWLEEQSRSKEALSAAAGPAPWHSIPAEEVLDRLASSPLGLTADEAERRLERDGPNRLTPQRGRSSVGRFLAQFTNTLVLVLVVATAVMVLIGEYLDAVVVGAVVLLNALIGFIQEGRAEQALEAVRKSVAPEATAIRDGQPSTLAAERLVRGDFVALKAGDVVPADVRLVEEQGLEVQQGALTGESEPVEKSVEPVPEDAPLAERRGVAWSGTIVARGIGRGVVTATGDSTEIGRIGRMLAESGPRDTPLSRQLSRFSRRLTLSILLLAAAVFFVGAVLWDRATVEMFRAAIGLAIAAVPEALPAILTITMAVGVTRMAKRRAIIRKLPAVEALGSVEVIWTDKTGTITRNQLTVRAAATADARFEVEGIGYAPEGEIRRVEKAKVGADGLLEELALGALLANDGELRQEGGEWAVEGDLTDGALLAFAAKVGLDIKDERRAAQRVAEIPYEADQQYMATLNRAADRPTLWIKGAPERILDLCGSIASHDDDHPLDRNDWDRTVEEMARQGLRLIAVARRGATAEELTPESVEEGGFTLVGIVGMIDPARPEARDSIASAQSAGIEVKMITGDHPLTATAIAESVGLRGKTVTGPELDALSDAEFDAAARDAAIVARATPEHKQRLIESLQRQGLSSAMTGDGFNDAPALLKADVGVSMGGRGTEAAREASDIVLTDDNFASIVAAVREGRTVYDNIRKAIAYILPTSFGEAGLIILAVLVGQPLPITALQILWINLVTEATLSVAIAFDPPEPDIMRRPPRPRDARLLSRFLIWRISFVALMMTTGGWVLFQMFAPASVDVARTVVVNALVAFEIAYLLNCRRLRGSSLGWNVLTDNRAVLLSIGAVIVLQLLFTYGGFMNALFDSAPLAAVDWLLIGCLGLLFFLVIEVEKRLTRNVWLEVRAS